VRERRERRRAKREIERAVRLAARVLTMGTPVSRDRALTGESRIQKKTKKKRNKKGKL